MQEVHDPKPMPDQKKLMKNMLNLTSKFTKSKGNTQVRTYQVSPRAGQSATTPANMFSQKFNFMGNDTKSALANMLLTNQNNETKAQTSDL